MVLPIVGYGHPVLRQETDEIEQNYPVKELIKNMFETMYNASGVGLAAPQIAEAVRLFIVDGSPFSDMEDISEEESKQLSSFRKVFINPIIVEEKGEEWAFEEGCLSIPGVNADVIRKDTVVIEYYNEKWELLEETYTGLAARIIQHEYDHIEGVLFPDLVSPLKKKFLAKKLSRIVVGDVSASYKMKFSKRKR
ncbi:MAG: peptide deformylase [Salibacteraceae bacterium]|jgi:peptide deformylase